MILKPPSIDLHTPFLQGEAFGETRVRLRGLLGGRAEEEDHSKDTAGLVRWDRLTYVGHAVRIRLQPGHFDVRLFVDQTLCGRESVPLRPFLQWALSHPTKEDQRTSSVCPGAGAWGIHCVLRRRHQSMDRLAS